MSWIEGATVGGEQRLLKRKCLKTGAEGDGIYIFEEQFAKIRGRCIKKH
jgi:hypothetical protein